MRALVHASPASRMNIAGLPLLERMIVALRRAGVADVTVSAAPAIARWSYDGEALTIDGAFFAVPGEVRRAVEERREPEGVLVTDDASRLCAERTLWASLDSPLDGIVDRWLNRPLGRLVSRLLVHTPATPNQVTIAATLVGLAGAALLAHGAWVTAVAGALVFQLSAALDCVDGDLARIRFQESRLGKWLDLTLDNVVHLAVFVAIAAHCVRVGSTAPVTALAVSMCVGTLLSFAIVARSQALPVERRNPRVSALIDRMANRDFSLLVLVLAAAGRLDWFLWLAGIGVHVFWIAALVLLTRRVLSLIGGAIGLALFAWVAWRAGPANILRVLEGIGWLALFIPVPQLVAYWADTLGWRASFGARVGTPSLWTLYWIRMAGEAVNYLTPSAYVGGEPVKAILLRKRGVPGTIAAASVVEAKTLMTVAEVLFVVIGTACALGTVSARTGLAAGIGATIVAGAALAVFLVALQRNGLFMGLLALARRIGLRIGALERREEKLRALDAELARFYREEPRAFFASIGWHLVGWVLGAGEVWFGMWLLGVPISVADAIAIEAIAAVIKGATLFVPGSIGFQETGFVFLCPIFGLPIETGVGFGILRRARELFCSALGLGWAAIH